MTDRRREALTHVGGAIETQGDPDLAEILRRAWEAASERAGYDDALTHGVHAYPARMPPSLARVLFDALAPRRVLDPFCGAGTVLVEARLAGAAATGVDLNPLALQLAAVKTRATTPAERGAFVRTLRAVAVASEARVRAREPARAPLRGEDLRRYGPHVLKELAGLLAEIRAVRDRRIRAALEMVFSAIVIKVSQQRAETAERLTPKRIRKGLSTEFFARKGEELEARWAELAEALPPHRRRAAWLGVRRGGLEEREIGARRHLRERADRRRWDAERGAALRVSAGRLGPHGLLVLVLGDGQIGGARIPAEDQVAALAPAAGLRPVARASPPRRDWTGGPPRREHLLALQRKR